MMTQISEGVVFATANVRRNDEYSIINNYYTNSIKTRVVSTDLVAGGKVTVPMSYHKSIINRNTHILMNVIKDSDFDDVD